MKYDSSIRPRLTVGGLRLLMLAFMVSPQSWGGVPQVLDTFDDPHKTSLDTPRLLISDAGIGGKSEGRPLYGDGKVRVEGEISPARGQPGFVSFVLLLSSNGEPQDVSEFEGVELKIRVLEGTVSLLAASSDIKNFDYHAKPLVRSKTFRTLRIPFVTLKRVWSEQTPLNKQTVTSINIVASSIAETAFCYEVESVAFFK